jgi:hypothetical protein
VIIEGFKSYRERTVLEPFHPNLNVIGKDHEILAKDLFVWCTVYSM